MIPKYRAWDKSLQRWCPYRIYSLEKLGDDVVEFMYVPQGVWYKNEELFDNFVLMQSTGLKDKNGVEIFEGDIVKIKQQDSIDKYIPNNSTNEIIYKDSAFCVKETWGIISDTEWPIIAGLYYKVSEEFEVVGNVYENPELLEETE